MIAGDLDVGPQNAAAEPEPQRLENGFLCSESSGQVLVRVPTLKAVRLLGKCEAAFDESASVLGSQIGDAGDFDDVNAVGDRVHGQCPGVSQSLLDLAGLDSVDLAGLAGLESAGLGSDLDSPLEEESPESDLALFL